MVTSVDCSAQCPLSVMLLNGADMSPAFLYNISEPVDETPLRKVAEDHATYG